MLRWALVVVCVCAVAAHARTQAEVEVLFNEFIVDHNKQYDAEEYNERLQVFANNLEYIDTFNAQNPDMTLGITKHADLSHEEYVRTLRATDTSSAVRAPSLRDPSHFLPPSVDWRNQSVVGPVMDATGCESPYAVVGCVTSFCAITNNKFQYYDPAQVSTCINANTCNISEDESWRYVNKIGLHAEWNSSSTCGNNWSAGCCFAAPLCIGEGNEFQLQTAVGLMGPITVSVDGTHQSFQHYNGGIYYEPQCTNYNLTVNLLVVGYGSTNHQDYWIAQNFWGTSWGVNGYILMSRNLNNNCGIASFQCHPLAVHQCKW